MIINAIRIYCTEMYMSRKHQKLFLRRGDGINSDIECHGLIRNILLNTEIIMFISSITSNPVVIVFGYALGCKSKNTMISKLCFT
jgi:hypothetical protein